MKSVIRIVALVVVTAVALSVATATTSKPTQADTPKLPCSSMSGVLVCGDLQTR